MMKCVNCGFEIPDGGAFCPGCGIRLGVKSINTKTKARIWPAVIIALLGLKILSSSTVGDAAKGISCQITGGPSVSIVAG